MKEASKTKKMLYCALFTAATAILAQLVIPIGVVPVNLTTFAVFCAGAVLGAKLGAISLAVYALAGAAGAPVFAMLRGGLGVLFGPTGGFIMGCIPAAFICGLITQKLNRRDRLYPYIIAMLCAMLTYFITGTAWYMFITNTGLAAALSVCVLPFIPGDIMKIAAAAVISKRLYTALDKPDFRT